MKVYLIIILIVLTAADSTLTQRYKCQAAVNKIYFRIRTTTKTRVFCIFNNVFFFVVFKKNYERLIVHKRRSETLADYVNNDLKVTITVDT